MLPERKAICSFASEGIPILEQNFVKWFSEFEKYFNRVKSLQKFHSKKIVSRLYRQGLFDEKVFKLMKVYSKNEVVTFNKSLKCHHHLLHTCSEKIVNTLRRCDSLSDAKIIADKILSNRVKNTKEIISGYFEEMIQLHQQLMIRLRTIIEQHNRKTSNKNETNKNSKKGISQMSNISSSAKISSVAEKLNSNRSKTIFNLQAFSVNFKFDWKYFRKK